VKHVVSAAELLGFLHGHDVPGIFDDAEQARISSLIATDLALSTFCNVEAPAAKGDALFHCHDRVGKPERIF
jgi:hypothetical protein